jgi:hypothetical protein
MIRYPTHLHFDQSGTAVARFLGDKVGQVTIHPKEGHPWHLSACPESVDELGRKCLACQKGLQSQPRSVALAWDLQKNKWCVLVATSSLILGIYRAAMAAVGHEGLFREGLGPDLVLQRAAGRTLVEAVPETMGERRGSGDPPPLVDFMRGLESRSAWTL